MCSASGAARSTRTSTCCCGSRRYSTPSGLDLWMAGDIDAAIIAALVLDTPRATCDCSGGSTTTISTGAGRRARLPVPLADRGLRPSSDRGDGVRLSGRCLDGALPARNLRRGRALRRPRRPGRLVRGRRTPAGRPPPAAVPGRGRPCPRAPLLLARDRRGVSRADGAGGRTLPPWEPS